MMHEIREMCEPLGIYAAVESEAEAKLGAKCTDGDWEGYNNDGKYEIEKEMTYEGLFAGGEDPHNGHKGADEGGARGCLLSCLLLSRMRNAQERCSCLYPETLYCMSRVAHMCSWCAAVGLCWLAVVTYKEPIALSGSAHSTCGTHVLTGRYCWCVCLCYPAGCSWVGFGHKDCQLYLRVCTSVPAGYSLVLYRW